jgi:AraC-like DNA-binding protein
MDDAALRRQLVQLGALHSDTPDALRLDELEALRSAVEGARSPLLHAEFVLLRARLHETRRPVAEMAADLELALLTFAANQRERQQLQCQAQLAYWYNLMGHEVSALAVAHRAMRHPGLPPEDRLALFTPVAMAYAHQLRLGDAWQAWERDFRAEHARCSDARLLREVHGTLASLHFFEALQARRVATVYTLDLDAGPPDHARFTAQLAEVERQVHASRHAGSALPDPQRLGDLLGMVAALRGDADRMQAHLTSLCGPPEQTRPTHGQLSRLYNLGWSLRVLGRPEQALPCLLAVRSHLDTVGMSKLVSRLPYDLSCTYEALGDPTAALRELRHFLRLRSEMAAADSATLGRLQDLSAQLDAPLGGFTPPRQLQVGSTRIDPVTLHQSEPPYLARLDRLLHERTRERRRPAELASELGVSLRTLQAALQRYRGSTLVAMQRRIALQRASEQLRLTELPIRDIAATAGFPDAASFSHAFRREFGVSPSMHRRRGLAGSAAPAAGELADASD